MQARYLLVTKWSIGICTRALAQMAVILFNIASIAKCPERESNVDESITKRMQYSTRDEQCILTFADLIRKPYKKAIKNESLISFVFTYKIKREITNLQ